MSIIYAFLVGGLICMLAELLLDITKLSNLYIVVILIIIGSLLEIGNLYDKLVLFSGAGALLPISSFGHTMTHSALENSVNGNYLSLLGGIMKNTSAGISYAIFLSFILSLLFKPKG